MRVRRQGANAGERARRGWGETEAGIGTDFGEDRAEEEDEGGVVNPEQDEDERGGGTECGGGAFAAEIITKGELADLKEGGGKEGADPNIRPGDTGVRKDFEEGGEEKGEGGERKGRGQRAGEERGRTPSFG